jgi:hypothetical protein
LSIQFNSGSNKVRRVIAVFFDLLPLRRDMFRVFGNKRVDCKAVRFSMNVMRQTKGLYPFSQLACYPPRAQRTMLAVR